MANHKNYRRPILRESHGTTCRTNYCKGVRASCKFEKREWNRHVRRDGREFCEDFKNLHATQAGVYSRRQCPVEVIYNLRPWMD